MKTKNRLQQVLNTIALPFRSLKNIALRATAISTMLAGSLEKTDVVAKTWNWIERILSLFRKPKYITIMERLLELINKGQDLKLKASNTFDSTFSGFSNNVDNQLKLNKGIADYIRHLTSVCKEIGFEIIPLRIENEFDTKIYDVPNIYEFEKVRDMLTRIIELLINQYEICLEKYNRNDVQIISAGDIDQFRILINQVKPNEIDIKYFKSAFYEQIIKDNFLKIFNEPYEQKDSAAELCDMTTDNLTIDGKRIPSIIMLKGKSIKKEMQISDCGINGDQLIKLSKNKSARLYIVQHVNSISQNVKDALLDHITVNSHFRNTKICFIDGQDTAMILAGFGCDLEKLNNMDRPNFIYTK